VGVFTEYGVLTAGSVPHSIVSGPDGNLWFIEGLSNKIGRITTAGNITEYAIPATDSSPGTMISGPDGNLWFTDVSSDGIWKITTAGIFTAYNKFINIITYTIIPGPDGNIWFAGKIYKCINSTCEYLNCVGKITTTGMITDYQILSGISPPGTIISGLDGNLWFIDENNNSIGVVRN
jgi:streptogramin lyase